MTNTVGWVPSGFLGCSARMELTLEPMVSPSCLSDLLVPSPGLSSATLLTLSAPTLLLSQASLPTTSCCTPVLSCGCFSWTCGLPPHVRAPLALTPTVSFILFWMLQKVPVCQVVCGEGGGGKNGSGREKPLLPDLPVPSLSFSPPHSLAE